MKVLLTSVLLSTVALGIWAASAGCSPGSSADSSATPAADLKTATFKVEGMTCGGCEAGVKMAVKKLDGVHEVEASYERASARVKYEPAKIQPETIKAAIEKLGYQASLEAGS